MLAKITQKAPVTRRKLWDSYNKPSGETFQPVLDALLASGKVVYLGDELLVPADWDPSGGSAGESPAAPKATAPQSPASSADRQVTQPPPGSATAD